MNHSQTLQNYLQEQLLEQGVQPLFDFESEGVVTGASTDLTIPTSTGGDRFKSFNLMYPGVS